MGVFVNSNVDSGNIDVVNISNPLDHVTHELELKVGGECAGLGWAGLGWAVFGR